MTLEQFQAELEKLAESLDLLSNHSHYFKLCQAANQTGEFTLTDALSALNWAISYQPEPNNNGLDEMNLILNQIFE